MWCKIRYKKDIEEDRVRESVCKYKNIVGKLISGGRREHICNLTFWDIGDRDEGILRRDVANC